jgi:ATP-dependent helicase/nuclease subunit B
VQVRFLSGPAGSGKTFRCLTEIRDALCATPEGPPLIFIAPKQATFQLEYQLLSDGRLNGYTRLHILSFERLARFVFEKLNVTPPEFLSDEGRVMVLRALLMRHEQELKLFRGSARRSGFAQEISRLLNELQQHQLPPSKLRALAENKTLRVELRNKLSDLALLHEYYSHWLDEHKLQDGNRLLEAATELLQANPGNAALRFSALCLDGFAEMTPQEMDLLAGIIPFCERATLAFCLDEPGETERSWLSIWNAVGKTYQQCRQRIEHLPGCKIEVETLPRDLRKSRFSESLVLRDLEKRWQEGADAKPAKSGESKPSELKIVVCQNPEGEAIFAAREILKFVRDGNRFRDCAVIVRNLDPFHKIFARTFRRFGIPFFLDRRESVAHHPLAELSRNALRTVAFDWRHEDWFATLKTGFWPVDETEIDRLENESLEHGWQGKKWREPFRIPDNPEREERLEKLRQKVFGPFEVFYRRLAESKFQPTGKRLAESLRELWNDLRVMETIESQYAASQAGQRSREQPIHNTVWEQMNLWLDNVELAFLNEPMSLRDWLPVLDTGLANLTVGVIPPALDEVLIGAIDRARNPELKFALVLGTNETIFPAAPISPVILTDADRDELNHIVSLGADLRERLARERYYGYIAFTRASEKLAVTYSRSDANSHLLNPSPFITRLQTIFPQIPVEDFDGHIQLDAVESASELIPTLVEIQGAEGTVWTEGRRFLASFSAISELEKNLGALREPDPKENLAPATTERLYGKVLKTSVSRLEEFAQCPFKFFIRSGLRAGERKIFELDARERGTFQHDVLKIFHEQLVAEKKQWRDLTSREARKRVGQIAANLAADFRGGLLRDSPQTKFAARTMAESLQDFVEVIVSWMREQYKFDPVAVELDFGDETSRMPAWEIDLKGGHKLALRGRIDRIDLYREPKSKNALAVVLDYKSSGKRLEAVYIENGLQLQLAAYLNALRHFKNPRELFGVEQLIPAGVFYINLRGQFENGKTRAEVLTGANESRRLAYRHTGRFDTGIIDKLDSAGAADQFNYRRNQDGSLHKGSLEGMSAGEFGALLDRVEAQLRRIGNEIFSGVAQVDPFRKGAEIACKYCDYSPACRIDPWTHQFRVLGAKTVLTE